jgi:hypothetical protein
MRGSDLLKHPFPLLPALHVGIGVNDCMIRRSQTHSMSSKAGEQSDRLLPAKVRGTRGSTSAGGVSTEVRN